MPAFAGLPLGAVRGALPERGARPSSESVPARRTARAVLPYSSSAVLALIGCGMIAIGLEHQRPPSPFDSPASAAQTWWPGEVAQWPGQAARSLAGAVRFSAEAVRWPVQAPRWRVLVVKGTPEPSPTAPRIALSATAPPPTALPLWSPLGTSAASAPEVTSPAADATPSAGPVLSRSVPVHLDIAEIGVHTGLSRLGLQPDGTVAVPPLTKDASAGWYKYSVTPGERGAAVIVGHVDSAADGPAVFFRLGALRSGDEVSVRRADGKTAVFRVTQVSEYPKSDFPTRAVYGGIDYPGLRLVTCGGGFDRARGRYRDNVVVYATLVRVLPQ